MPVSLRIGQERVVIEAAVDTGASFCLFARSLAESLGIDLESGLPPVFASANGSVETFGHTVHLTVLGIDVEPMVFFFANGNIRKNLLGRRGGWTESCSDSTSTDSSYTSPGTQTLLNPRIPSNSRFLRTSQIIRPPSTFRVDNKSVCSRRKRVA